MSAGSVFGLVVAAVLLPAFDIQIQAATDQPPNILLILADDLGYGDVSCYNSESKVQTPHLDELAAEGMRFTDAHSPSTVCTPSRYSLMTGRMCFRTGYRGVFSGVGGPALIKADRLTLPQLLRNNGYVTACIDLGFAVHDGKPDKVAENFTMAVGQFLIVPEVVVPIAGHVLEDQILIL